MALRADPWVTAGRVGVGSGRRGRGGQESRSSSICGTVPITRSGSRGVEWYGGEFRVGDLDAFGVPVGVVGGLHAEAGLGGGRGDEFDDGAQRQRARRREYPGL